MTATPPPATLDELLSMLEWQVEASRRVELAVGERLEFRGATFLFVLGGSVLVRSEGPQGVSLAFAEEDAVVAVGRHAVGLRAETAAEVVVVELRPVAGVRAIDLLPDVIGVSRLGDLDPAMALLASRMGCPIPAGRRRAGDSAICGRFATTIIAVAIRAWAEGECAPAEWLTPAGDPFVTRVLDAMHEDPGRPWTVGDLAAVGAMSRTVFAERFRAQVGRSPASYLTQLRMDAARSYLSDDGLTVSETARMLGYESDEGFSRAFRRHTGLAPSRWRQRAEA